jgi:hypothetical protein
MPAIYVSQRLWSGLAQQQQHYQDEGLYNIEKKALKT